MDFWTIKFLWPFFTIEAIAIITASAAFYLARVKNQKISATLFLDYGLLLTGTIAFAPLILPLGLYWLIKERFGAP